MNDVGVVLGAPSRLEDLPESEPILPGHSLIRPSLGMLKSAIKYPHKAFATVYGSPDNIGIAYDGKNERVTYSDFRRSLKGDAPLNNDFRTGEPSNIELKKYLDRLNNLLQNLEHPMLGRTMYGFRKMNKKTEPLKALSEPSLQVLRKRRKKHAKKNKKDFEVFRSNPGNPYTVYKNRYLRNYLWNLAMTGDHMNINPNAPEFTEAMPADMVRIRKWWYFNQDDFKPFNRR